MSALPAGWVMTCIADIALFNPKTIAEDSLKAAFAPMQFLGTRYRDRMAFEERPWGEIKKAYVHFQPRDVIVAKVTPCFENGKAGVAPPLPNSIGAGSSEFCVFRPAQGVDERYLLAWLSTEDFRRRATVAMTMMATCYKLKRLASFLDRGVDSFFKPAPSKRQLCLQRAKV